MTVQKTPHLLRNIILVSFSLLVIAVGIKIVLDKNNKDIRSDARACASSGESCAKNYCCSQESLYCDKETKTCLSRACWDMGADCESNGECCDGLVCHETTKKCVSTTGQPSCLPEGSGPCNGTGIRCCGQAKCVPLKNYDRGGFCQSSKSSPKPTCSLSGNNCDSKTKCCTGLSCVDGACCNKAKNQCPN